MTRGETPVMREALEHVLESTNVLFDALLEPFETLLEVLRSPFEDQEGRDHFSEPASPDFGTYRTFCGT